jgi:pimeloyl-ACP methyl ester carboxylesterase
MQLSVETAFGPIDTLVDGDGPPLLFLHGDTGRGDWSPFLRELAATHQVFAPSMPGYDASPLLTWMRDVRQLASVMSAYLHALDVDPGVRVDLVGRGLGAWVAAEMLVAGTERIANAVLVSPVGLKPESGVIVDQFLIDVRDWVRLGYSTDERYQAEHAPPAETVVDQWELNRETTTRIAWKPYMYDQALPYLLAAARGASLVVAAEDDRIVAPSVAQRYAELLPGATYSTLSGGHFLELEQPVALATIASDFLLSR